MKKMERFGNDIQYPVLEFLNWSPQTDRHLGGHPWKINHHLSVIMEDTFWVFIEGCIAGANLDKLVFFKMD